MPSPFSETIVPRWGPKSSIFDSGGGSAMAGSSRLVSEYFLPCGTLHAAMLSAKKVIGRTLFIVIWMECPSEPRCPL